MIQDAEIQSLAGEGNFRFVGFWFFLVNREKLRGYLCRSGTSLGPGLGDVKGSAMPPSCEEACAVILGACPAVGTC